MVGRLDTRHEEEVSDHSPSLTEEDIHHVLSNRRRRALIELLLENGDGVSLREFSERIAEIESGETPAPRDTRQSVYVSLHQTHLPKLDDFGILDYDIQSKTVTRRNPIDQVIPYMGMTSERESSGEGNGEEISWSRVHLVIGVLGIMFVYGADSGVPVLGMVPPQYWAYLILGIAILVGGIETILPRTSRSGRS